MEKSSKEVVQHYLDVLLAGDIEGIRNCFAEDAIWTMHADLPMAGPWKGRDAIVDDFLVHFGGTLYQQGSQQFEFPTLIGEGETVSLEWRVRALTAKGEDYDNSYCGIFIVRDGKIQEVREYFDTAYAERTLFAA